MGFSGIAFGLPFAMNSAEGTEASMFVAAAASRSSWKKAMFALGAALVTLVPVVGLIWVIFHFVGANYLDYAIAVVVFLLGLRAVKEGLDEKPSRSGHSDPGAREAIGLAPASAVSVKDFQQRHGLRPTGIIGEAERAAVRAARSEAGYSEVDSYVFGVDVADAARVSAFQKRHFLPATGLVDAATRGALRVAQQQGLLDTLDAGAVRRFQTDHGLEPTGDVDDATAVALATVRSEGATTLGPPRDDGAEAPRIDPVTALSRLDAADQASVRRFQQSLGLNADGAVRDETRGAIRAVRARTNPDPANPESTRRLQADCGLAVTGVIDDTTRGAARSRLALAVRPRPAGLVPDPADEEGTKAFQRSFGLDDDGVIGESTRQALNVARDYMCDVDPTDPRSVADFQHRHGLNADGIIGPRTQAALSTVRAERVPDSDKEQERRYGDFSPGSGAAGYVLDVDIAEPDAVRSFQASHHLAADGVVGPSTREALAVVRQQRLEGGPLVGDHSPPTGQRGPVALMRTRMGRAWPAYVGVILETSEALLYSFAVANSSLGLLPAIIGAGVGYTWPWATLPLVRRVTQRVAEWKQEFVIGLVLVGVSTTFGILHAVGVFH